MSAILNKKEQNALLDQPDIRYPVELRNLCLLHMGLKFGLRLSEQIALKWTSLDLSGGPLMIGQYERFASRRFRGSDQTLSLLKTWKQWQKHEWEKRNTQDRAIRRETDYVFTTLRGNQISKSYVRNMVNMYADDARIDKNVTPDSLRKTFAQNLYDRTGNIRYVQHMLGFEDLLTTIMYLDSDPHQLDLNRDLHQLIKP